MGGGGGQVIDESKISLVPLRGVGWEVGKEAKDGKDSNLNFIVVEMNIDKKGANFYMYISDLDAIITNELQ